MHLYLNIYEFLKIYIYILLKEYKSYFEQNKILHTNPIQWNWFKYLGKYLFVYNRMWCLLRQQVRQNNFIQLQYCNEY